MSAEAPKQLLPPVGTREYTRAVLQFADKFNPELIKSFPDVFRYYMDGESLKAIAGDHSRQSAQQRIKRDLWRIFGGRSPLLDRHTRSIFPNYPQLSHDRKRPSQNAAERAAGDTRLRDVIDISKKLGFVTHTEINDLHLTDYEKERLRLLGIRIISNIEAAKMYKDKIHTARSSEEKRKIFEAMPSNIMMIINSETQDKDPLFVSLSSVTNLAHLYPNPQQNSHIAQILHENGFPIREFKRKINGIPIAYYLLLRSDIDSLIKVIDSSRDFDRWRRNHFFVIGEMNGDLPTERRIASGKSEFVPFKTLAHDFGMREIPFRDMMLKLCKELGVPIIVLQTIIRDGRIVNSKYIQRSDIPKLKAALDKP